MVWLSVYALLLAAAMSTMSDNSMPSGLRLAGISINKPLPMASIRNERSLIAKAGIFIGLVITIILAYNLGLGILPLPPPCFSGCALRFFSGICFGPVLEKLDPFRSHCRYAGRNRNRDSGSSLSMRKSLPL